MENGEMVGGLSIVPIIAEGALRHDNDAPTYFNGTSIVMEGLIIITIIVNYYTMCNTHMYSYTHIYIYKFKHIKIINIFCIISI